MFFLLLFLLLLFTLYLYLTLQQKERILREHFSEEESRSFVSNPIQYSNLLYKNLESGKLTKLRIQPKDVRREDCDEKCGAKECKIMYEQQRNLDACQKCHKNSRKCYRKSITGGNCEDCLEGEAQIQCNNVSNFGCVNPSNFSAKIGVDPYYVIKTTFTQGQNINQECRFCNDFTDLI
jgi:hypothetical protein